LPIATLTPAPVIDYIVVQHLYTHSPSRPAYHF
jgi:hypothetical protein